MADIHRIKVLREKKLINFLDTLAKIDYQAPIKNEARLESYYRCLKQIYNPINGNEYRHHYSAIYQKIVYLSREDEDLCHNLVGNLRDIFLYVENNAEKKGDVWLISYVEKLYDHVWLDVQRIENQKYIDKKVIVDGETIVDTLNNVERMNKQIDEHEEKIKDYFQKMDRAQTDIIGVISIFSTIILAFVGGMAFSTSVLENIYKPTIYRLFFILIVLAFVLINIIWGLLSIVRYINEKVKINNIPFYIVNGVLLALTIVSILAYVNDWLKLENNLNEKLKAIDSENNKVIHKMISEDIATNSPEPTEEVEKKKDEETENKKEENKEENKEK